MARHQLHSAQRCWSMTNCYVDLWIELLQFLELDPAAAGAFTLSSDFEGDQWTFFKPPPEDLRSLYGIEVAEMNIWRPVAEHVAEQLSFGRLTTVEVDAFHLPDTRGDSYGLAHVKTTIVPTSIDIPGRGLRYIHNIGQHELRDGDFDGVFPGCEPAAPALPPYVEVIKLERLWRDEARLVRTAKVLARQHLARAPGDNPIDRMGDRMLADVQWLRTADLKHFHQYAFGTCRQCGSAAELAADFVDWLGAHGERGLDQAAEQLRVVAEGAKVLQFTLARAARGRSHDLSAPLADMSDAWACALGILRDRYAD